MDAAVTRHVLLFGAYATIFSLVGIISTVAAFRWRSARRAASFLAAAMALHTVTLLTGSAAIRPALGGTALQWDWVLAIASYFTGLPWALLVEEIVGAGWKSSIRRTRQAFALYGIGATAFDLFTGRPGGAFGPWQAAVMGGGAALGVANLFFARIHTVPEIRVVRAGYSAFMLMVIHDNVSSIGLMPWTQHFGQLGVLTFVACLIYTIIARALREQAHLQRIEHELATARRIQQALLPFAPPQLANAAVAFRHVPAASVAGDLFQFLGATEHSAGMLVADVSGHGVGAALIASMVKVAAAAQEAHADDPRRVLEGIYASIASDLPAGQFVTAVYVYVDLERGVLRHAAAGHPPALIRRGADGLVISAGPAGPLMMSLATPDYPVTEVPLFPGDRVILYTDGIIEAMRLDGEMFGPERLSMLAASTPDGPESFVSATIEALSAFADRRSPGFDDDCTMVVFEARSLAVGDLEEIAVSTRL